jgi:hypothetical protein
MINWLKNIFKSKFPPVPKFDSTDEEVRAFYEATGQAFDKADKDNKEKKDNE